MKQQLFSYLRSKRVHPALLLNGSNPCEIFSTTLEMAKLLLCRKKQDDLFCDTCSICQRITKGIHPDVRILRREEDDTLKIELIREICHQMEIAPLESAYKICIIEGVERLNTASANAFLKTLEEPAENRFFWLITSQPGALLPTVVSRCLQFTFKPDMKEVVSDTFEKAFRDVLKSRYTEPIVSLVSEKADCLAFVQFIQTELRKYIQSGESRIFPESISSYDALDFFDTSVSLEGRLRSNANGGLLVDNYLRETFLKLGNP